MRNLELYNLRRQKLQEKFKTPSNIIFIDNFVYTVDSELQVCNKDGTVLSTFPDISSTTELVVLPDECRQLCFGTGTTLVALNTFDNKTVSVIDNLEAFAAAKWNSSKEYVAIVGDDGALGVYIAYFDSNELLPVQEGHLYSEFKNPFITVGWGSTTTQFQGSAKKNLKVQDDEEAVSSDEDPLPRICWRSDSQYFAVNFYHEGARKIRIYNCPGGDVIHESEPTIGLQGAVTWRPVGPAGNWISSPVWTSKRCGIAFFEHNGLQRSYFELPTTNHVLDLKWNKSGDVLAVHQKTSDHSTSIYLYTFRNFVWNMKQRLDFNDVNRVRFFEFIDSPALLNNLRVVTSSEVLEYLFKLTVHSTRNSYSPGDVITNVAIDGKKLLLTHCKEGLQPDPYCDSTTEVEESVNFIVFHPNKPRFITIDSNNQFILYNFDETTVKAAGAFRLPFEAEVPLKAHHFYWKHQEVIFDVLEAEGKLGKGCLTIAENTDVWKFHFEERTEPVNYVKALENSGAVVSENSLNVIVESSSGCTSSHLPCPSVYISAYASPEETYIFALSADMEFYVNTNRVLEGITSFMIHERYLFLRTIHHKLLCVRLNRASLEEFIKTGAGYAYIRSVEPNSVLLFGIPKSPYVLLQVPRGNIETCSCKMIALEMIEEYLAAGSWYAALNLARINKLSLNVLIDSNIPRFINNIDAFIDQVENSSIITEFLSELQEDNVLTKLYSDCHVVPEKLEIPGKLQTVCRNIIESLKRKNYIYYLGSITQACFAEKSESSLRNALEHVRNVLHSAVHEPTAIRASEKAMKVVSNLKFQEEIYNEALLTYDLDLILFIAQNLQMDPKEFEPFIAKLKKLQPNEQRLEINDLLKRPHKAILYLFLTSKNEEKILSYIDKHQIYKESYDLLDPDTDLFVKVSLKYGQFLFAAGKYEESGIIYSRASLVEEALGAYKAGSAWVDAIYLLKMMSLPPVKVHEHLQEAVEGLVSQGRVLEASFLYENELDRYEDALELLIKHKYFGKALEMAQKHRRADVCEEIHHAVRNHCQELTEKISTTHTTFSKHKLRLREIRTKKRDQSKQTHGSSFNFAPGNGQSFPPSDNYDVVSLVGTDITRTTNKTSSSRMSSRSRRKQEMKKLDLKVGGIYEDIALIKTLHDIITETFKLGPEVRELCLVELHLNLKTPGYVLKMHEALREVQEEMVKSLTEIWPSDMNSFDENIDPESAVVHENVKVMDVRYRVAPINLNTRWCLSILNNC